MKLRFWLFLLLAFFAYPLFSNDLSRGETGRIARLVGQILSSNHLRQEALNNRLSAVALENYLDALDVHHQVFLRSDIESFREKYSDRLDDFTLAERDAQPAFEIYNRYLDRLDERVSEVAAFLDLDHDFSIDETIDQKRSEKPWPETKSELSELWRKRIKADILQGRLQKEDAETIRERLTKRYARLLKTMKEMESIEILQIYLSAIGSAYDPHSNYMNPYEADDFKINNVKLQLSGIGALLREDDGYCRIVSLVSGGPAARSKQIKPGDRIIAVAQADADPVNVVEMKLRKVVEMIRGERGTEVRLTIASVDESEHKMVSLIRDVIELKDQQASAKVVDRHEAAGKKLRLGVIDLSQYYESSAEDVREIIQRLKLEEVDGILLDLRKNGGGILDEAVKLTGLFFSKGPVVQVRDFRNSITVLSDPDPRIAYGGPLVVLVSRLSASATEITAAALQDYGRAIVVGDQSTHGKGTVQTLQPLNRFMRRIRGATPKKFGMLKYTISNFYRVIGTSTQKYGVEPDIVLPSVYDYMELGEEHLPGSLEPGKVPAISFENQNRTAPYLAGLKMRSDKRVSESMDFAYVREDIDRYIEVNERQVLSLNEQSRLAQNAESKARIERRKSERNARPASKESVFLLSLDAAKNVESMVALPYLTASKPDLENEKTDETETALNSKPSDDSENIDSENVENAKNENVENENVENENVENENDDSENDDSENVEVQREYDPHLREALNILADYIDALKKSPSNPNSDLS